MRPQHVYIPAAEVPIPERARDPWVLAVDLCDVTHRALRERWPELASPSGHRVHYGANASAFVPLAQRLVSPSDMIGAVDEMARPEQAVWRHHLIERVSGERDRLIRLLEHVPELLAARTIRLNLEKRHAQHGAVQEPRAGSADVLPAQGRDATPRGGDRPDR